tara:strand:- start:1340 stop:2008 length:669 start_codon:yes stop_codon:yes gene_type:complete
MYNRSALAIFVVCCFLIRVLYNVVGLLLSTSVPKYASLEPHRKLYVQKNLIKSFVLAFMLPPALIWVVWPIWQSNVWHTPTIQYFAVVYGANDFVGLLCVNNLPKTTRIHHLISTFLVLTSLSMDFQTSSVAQSMLAYTFFAASSYIVNFQLAVRWCFPRGSAIWLRYLAGMIYVLSCAVSWCWQLWWAYSTSLEAYHFVYIVLMLWIVRDDIILMRWLTTH